MSTVLSTVASNIISDAIYLVGAKDLGSPLSAEESEVGLRFLNSFIKYLQSRGVQLHTVSDIEIDLYGSKQSYTVGPDAAYDVNTGRPMRIISARRRDADGYETPMIEVSREDYKRLPVKTTVGPPNQFAFEKLAAYGVVYIWPISDAASLAASDYTMIATIQRAIDIFDTSDDTPDLPSEMHLAITYCLADMIPYGTKMAREDVKRKAPDFLATLLATDQETTSIIIQQELRRR